MGDAPPSLTPSTARLIKSLPKRRRDDGGGSSEQPSKKANTSNGTKAPAQAKATRRRPPSQMYRLTKGDLPPGGKSVMDAFNTHVRILMNYLDPNTSPPLASGDIVGQYNARFTSVSEVFRDRYAKPSVHQRALLGTIAQFRKNPGNSKIAINAARVEEHLLHTVIAAQCHFGLSAFRPDFFSSPYSPYNAAHRIFAIDSFKQVAGANGYFFMHPKLSLINDMAFMTEVYDHIVHHEFQQLAKLEERNGKGAVAAQHSKDNAYQRRLRTANARGEYMMLEEYAAPRYIDFVGDPMAVSDDEHVPGTKNEYNILQKAQRSPRYTKFVADADDRRIALAASKPGYRLQGRTRKRPNNPKVSQMRSLPRPGIPLDYFGPDIFNALPYPIRRRYSYQPRIALPKKDEDIWDRKYMEMSDADFMRNEGGELLKEYNIVADASPPAGDDDMEIDGPPAPSAEQQSQFAALMADNGASGSGTS